MNLRMIIIFIIAILFASFAALIANNWIKNKAAPDKVATSKVVMAATDIPFGVKLEAFHLETIDWPGTNIPADSFDNIENVLGRITKNSFHAGEVINAKRITEHLGGSMLSSLIRQDSRAISIRVDDVVGVSGFVLPGNHVDILATRITRSGGAPKAKTRTILENIKVLAVDQEASPDKEKPAVVKSVTLELKPDEAEKIAAAMQEGKIQLTLRNPLDSGRIERKAKPKPAPVKTKPTPVRKKPASPFVVVPW